MFCRYLAALCPLVIRAPVRKHLSNIRSMFVLKWSKVLLHAKELPFRPEEAPVLAAPLLLDVRSDVVQH